MTELEPGADESRLTEAPRRARHVPASGDVEVAGYLKEAELKHGAESVPVEDTAAGSERESIILVDFGSQYSLLIARRVRECSVYCEIVCHDTPWEKVVPLKPRGIILSGGPASVYSAGAPMAPSWVYSSGLPILGICYGMQLLTQQLGGRVAPGTKQEYGHARLHLDETDSPLFAGLGNELTVWMSHGDRIDAMPVGFGALAHTENSPVAVIGNGNGIFGLQFHPEVIHTPDGKTILRNFAFRICKCQGNWTPGNFINDSIDRIRGQVGAGKVISAISGGVDSAVVSALIHKAIGDQLTCIFVDNGLLRREEVDRVFSVLNRNMGMPVRHADAASRFLKRLKGVIDPETKRKVIGEEFIRVFEEEANAIGRVDFLAQGTLYPDVIESASSGIKSAAKIKSHHNVGGLPSEMALKLVEPVRYLFKDEVRRVGIELGLPEDMVWRQPFPGPGLAVRIIGEVTWEKLELLRSADVVVMDEIEKAGLYRELWQSFAVLTNVHSVGVMGDYRTYGYMVAVRAVTSEDAMTADWARIPYDVLARISNRIVNEVPGVNRVVYDITSKPPSTIEWE
jgi:GMP synthase (glutamine-hydrolysing)